MMLKELSEAFGPSGNEKAVRTILRQALEGQVDRMWVDALGNLHTERQGKSRNRLRVLLTAHMDEVGFMVIGHDDSGGLRIRPIGGIDPRVLPGAIVWVGPDRVPGVIGAKPIHLQERGEGEKVDPIRQLVIDIGAKNKEKAQEAAPVGTTAVFATRFRELGPTVIGKAFDDRVGCAILAALLLGEPPRHTLHAVFTVQEEVGLRGARVAAYRSEPDCAVALEGTIADDLPKEKDASPTTELGQGPAITVMDRTFIAHRGLVQLLTHTAEELGIPYQIKQPGIGGTDAGAMHRVRQGVPSAAVAVPCRYIHGPVGMLNLADFENCSRLMHESLARLTVRTLRRE
ncbi:MAG: M42 family metallopeptidase [Anaerolineae bacterium]|nr:M42 family metallopeptidase [Anaerolineae bacterium]